jgi:hypothetical protein
VDCHSFSIYPKEIEMDRPIIQPELVPFGDSGNLWRQIGTATFTTTLTQITTVPTALTNIKWGMATQTSEVVTANDVPSVALGAVSNSTFTITRPASGTSGATVAFEIVGTLDVAAS